MVDFLKKPDPEVAKMADTLLHSANSHLIASYLDKSSLDTVKVIKEMESQAKHLGQVLPPAAIAGITEHLIHETNSGTNFSNEYHALSDADQVAVATQYGRQKGRGTTVHETPDGRLASVEVETSSGVFKPVCEPDKSITAAGKGVLGHIHIKKPF